VNLSERTVAVVLNEEGRSALELTAIRMADSPTLLVDVQDTDDIGLWVRVDREDGEHIVLIRWEYVLSVDFPAGETKTMGLRP
jgi:hypothetical protein